ncbi:DUF302 domain-containing protein [Nocardia sp. NPDC046763]|uniref:DUF302 domain-containing protein n=1 Tax=Nocardia sp. NPDC046763 TaxID=3155256 RepID=UPI0033D5EFFF
MRAKLGAGIEDYLILGARNPPLAHRVLDAERRIGLLLPCNVVVRSIGPDTVLVEATDPQLMADLADAPGMKAVADEAGDRLHAAIDEITAG